MDPDQELLQPIAQGDEHALRTLIERHRETLFRFAFRFVRNEADAAEIVADTFIRIHRNAHRFRPEAKVLTWAFSITANLCRDHHRRQSRHNLLSLFSPLRSRDSSSSDNLLMHQMADPQPGAPELLSTSEQQNILLRHIHSLPEKLKAPFILHVLEDHSQKECAEILGVTEKTIETRIYRARKKLQASVSFNN